MSTIKKHNDVANSLIIDDGNLDMNYNYLCVKNEGEIEFGDWQYSLTIPRKNAANIAKVLMYFAETGKLLDVD